MANLDSTNTINNKIIKTLVLFLCYFVYTNVVSSVLTGIGLTNGIFVSFFADIIFLIGIIYLYKENLKSNLEDLKTNYKLTKLVKIILSWVFVIFAFNIIMGVLSSIVPQQTLDKNTSAITSMMKNSSIYTLFKTMIFAVVAEELLFRESIGEVIKENTVFIVVSSIVYTIMNFIFVGLRDLNIFSVIHILSYFLPSLIFSYAYVKNKRNILILMFIKFAYQLIPLTILLLGL